MKKKIKVDEGGSTKPKGYFFFKTSKIDTVLAILTKDKKRAEQVKKNMIIKGDIIIDPTN